MGYNLNDPLVDPEVESIGAFLCFDNGKQFEQETYSGNKIIQGEIFCYIYLNQTVTIIKKLPNNAHNHKAVFVS